MRRTSFTAAIGLALTLFARPVAAETTPICPAQPTRTAPQAAAIDRALTDAWTDHGTIPGMAVAVVHGGKLIYARGFGEADEARHIPVDAGRTLFRIGSVTKLFTYVAALQLWREGRLNLDSDVNAYLGDAALPPRFGKPVRVRDLFTHRAGFEDGSLGYDFFGDAAKVPSLHDFVIRHRVDRVRPPGEAAVYSNFGVALLGYAIEHVSGMPYADIVRQRIFEPLGMRSTSLAEPVPAPLLAPAGRMSDPLAARAAIGYAERFGMLVPFPHEHIFPAAAPAGSAFSSATDMACFIAAALGDSPAPFDARIRAMFATRPYRDHTGLADYGHGFIDGRIGSLPMLQHGGAMGGFRSNLTLLPTLDTGIFVAVNSAAGGTFANRIPQRVAKALSALADAMPPQIARPEKATRWQRFAGRYLTERRSWDRLETMLSIGDGEVRITIDPAGWLMIAQGGGAAVRYAQIAPSLFAHDQDRALFTGGRLYLDMRPYAPVSWLGSGAAIAVVRWVAAIAGLLLILGVLRLRPRDPALLASVPAAVGAMVLGWLIPHALTDASARGEFLAYAWPTDAIVAMQWIAGLTCAAALLGLAMLLAQRDAIRRPLTLLHIPLSAALVALTLLLAHWNLFAPSAN